jgi:hypothetical protein
MFSKYKGWIAGGVIAVLALLAISINNTVVTQESGIIGANKARQATLSNISQKVKEVIGVKNMNVEDIQKTVNEQIKLRAGADGMKNMVLMLKEHNIAPSQEAVIKIMNIIDIGRETFLKQENMMTDRKTAACMYRSRFPNNFIINIMGSAKLNIGCFDGQDDYAPLMNDKATESFKTGVDGGLY